jgi:predicted ATPase
MISCLDLKYFKCFELLHLPLAQLTLLSGANASGKSSALQALILLHQTMREHEWSTRLMLNGKSIKLGTVLDVINESQGGKSFEIGLTYKNLSYSWTFTGERTELSMDVEKICITNNTSDTKNLIDYTKLKEKHPDHAPDYLQKLLPTFYTLARHDFHMPYSIGERKDNFITDIHQPLTTGFTYITAERIGPRETYTLEDKQIAYAVGSMGEHAMSLFYSNRDEPILDDLILETESRNTLFHQVTARMQFFFPNCLLAVEKVQNVNAVTLRLKTSSATEFHRPVNVGFGLTQVLPIVIAALSAQKEDILLIENPEVHLHPAGQALMGQFLAEVASAGVQVILETHSDHILNGIRRFVKAGGIPPDQVALHFFRPRSINMAQVVSPQMNANGDLDFWPDGFFDQFDKDMNHFAGWE